MGFLLLAAENTTNVTANELDITATGTNSSTPTSTDVSVGLLAGLGATSTATITQSTTAYIASGAHVTATNTPVVREAASARPRVAGSTMSRSG